MRRLLILGVTAALATWGPGSATGLRASSPEPALTGTLSIDSDPLTAAVYVDGRFIGRTPVTVPALPSGDHRVRLVKDGYLENSRLISVSDRTPTTLTVHLTARAPQAQAARAMGIYIVVIAGEGAVNIIQRNTAVAPIVEVRDRNDLPVSGATVTFTMGGGNAATFAGGAQMLTVTTSAAGRATTTAIRPVMAGRYQIQVQAGFQGQTATATVTQVNYATLEAAQAAGATTGAGGTSVGSGAGAAGAPGGGLSGVAVGAIVGGAAGGALVAVKAASGGSSSSSGSGSGSTNTGGSTGPMTTTLSGPFSGQMVVTTTVTSSGGTTSCASTRSISGTLTISLQQQSDGTVTGTASTSGTQAEISVTVSPFCQASFGSVPFNTGGSITGTPASLGYTSQSTATSTTTAVVTVVNTTDFTGTLSNGVITGTLNHTETSSGHQIAPNDGVISGNGSTSMAVTLR